MISHTNAAAVVGIDGYSVRVEVDFTRGLRDCFLVGLPDGAIRESVKRVQSAIRNSGFEWPRGRIIINLSPAGVRKDGTGFDLPIALGILLASGQVEEARGVELGKTVFVGELSLDGSVRPVPGVLPRTTMAEEQGMRVVVVSRSNVVEAAMIRGIDAIPIDTLEEAVLWIEGATIEPYQPDDGHYAEPDYPVDFCEVRGQDVAKRALEIAAAGGHNVLMMGPPGAGKTMLARRLVTILPPLSYPEAIETTKVYSVASALPPETALILHRPFRAPHFTISDVGMSGGGSGIPRPGQISLAHNGVLFLDELPEYSRRVLESMRGPLEDKHVTLTRGMVTLTYPASLILIAAMNPCPCGYYGSQQHTCECSYHDVQKYRNRISGPLLDRIDLQTSVSAVSYAELTNNGDAESSANIKERVKTAREAQQQRFSNGSLHCNAEMEARHLKSFCELDAAGHRLLSRCIDNLGVSARGYSRILKVARTLADLESCSGIAEPHVAEAILYRQLDVDETKSLYSPRRV